MSSRYVKTMRRRYENPYFSRAMPRKSWPRIAGTLAMVTLAVGLGFFWFTPLLAWQGIIIEGARPATARAVWERVQRYGQEKSLGRMRSSHISLLASDRLAQQLSDELFLDVARVHRDGRVVVVSVIERTPKLIIIAKDGYYLGDGQGSALSALPDDLAVRLSRFPLTRIATTTSPTGTVMLDPIYRDIVQASSTLPTFVLQDRDTVVLRATPLTKSQRSFLWSLLGEGEQRLGSSIRSIARTGPGGAFLDVRVEEGWTARLDSDRDLQDQLNALARVLSGLSITRTSLDYIDVRFKDRAFYKER